MAKEKKGNMTVEEAGRKGGEQTSKTHGQDFYQEIGHKGGEAGGSKGGHATQEEVSRYEEIKKKGQSH